MTNTKHDERKQSLEWFLEGRSAVHCDSSGAGRWVKGVGGGRASKTRSPCDYHLMRVSLLILSKNVPITRTSTLSELWLCIWGKEKNPLVWLRWSLRRSTAAKLCPLTAEWHVNHPVFNPISRESPSFHLQGSCGVRRRLRLSSWVTFTTVIHLAGVFWVATGSTVVGDVDIRIQTHDP